MRPSKAIVDLDALRHNLALAARHAPDSRNIAVIKANAYGHGMIEAARALENDADALSVATMDEAVVLREAGIGGPLLVLQGHHSPDDIGEAAARDLWLMLHERGQADTLLRHSGPPVRTWLKIDTGMHRLGIPPGEAGAVIDSLLASAAVAGLPVLCTHLACADETENPATARQVEIFHSTVKGRSLPTSIANSAGIMHWPATHADWNRPGIMLYGSDPTNACPGHPELKAVMTLQSEVMAVRDIAAGEGVGYGARWVAEKPARIATVSIGYGDGYPRHAPNGTPVLVNGKRAPLAGTVSMDMITVDITGREDVRVGDPVELWGPNLPVNEIAACAGTIGYELLAGMTARLPRVFRPGA